MSYAWFRLSGNKVFAIVLLAILTSFISSGAARAFTTFPPFGGWATMTTPTCVHPGIFWSGSAFAPELGSTRWPSPVHPSI